MSGAWRGEGKSRHLRRATRRGSSVSVPATLPSRREVWRSCVCCQRSFLRQTFPTYDHSCAATQPKQMPSTSPGYSCEFVSIRGFLPRSPAKTGQKPEAQAMTPPLLLRRTSRRGSSVSVPTTLPSRREVWRSCVCCQRSFLRQTFPTYDHSGATTQPKQISSTSPGYSCEFVSIRGFLPRSPAKAGQKPEAQTMTPPRRIPPENPAATAAGRARGARPALGGRAGITRSLTRPGGGRRRGRRRPAR